MPDARLPPVRTLSAALRRTTELLMRELNEPSAHAPDWAEHEWRVAQAVAAIHGIAPLLASRLSWRGPASWCSFLEQQREHTRRRHERIIDVLAQIDTTARSRSLSVVALKGAALHELGIYRPGERPMSDIDLLVHSRDRQEAVKLIESLRYDFSHEIWKHAVFEPHGVKALPSIGEHVDNPIKIELHTAIAEMLPIERCDLSDIVLPRTEVPGLSFYGSKSALMAHLLLHAAGAVAMHSMRGIHLYDVARLSRVMTASDWDDVAALTVADKLWWCLPVVALAQRYFPGSIPRLVVEHAERACAWPLRAGCVRRALTDVSLSDLRIRAFPGIEWSRSPVDAWRCVSARLWPSRETLILRKQYGKFQSLGAESPWVRSSQLARMARWATGGAVRVETMASVRAAFTD